MGWHVHRTRYDRSGQGRGEPECPGHKPDRRPAILAEPQRPLGREDPRTALRHHDRRTLRELRPRKRPPAQSQRVPLGLDARDRHLHRTLVSEYRTPQNQDAYCQTPAGMDPANTTYTSYSTHNLTVLPDVAIVAWHSNGLRAVDITDPAHPASAGSFLPQPLSSVAT